MAGTFYLCDRCYDEYHGEGKYTDKNHVDEKRGLSGFGEACDNKGDTICNGEGHHKYKN